MAPGSVCMPLQRLQELCSYSQLCGATQVWIASRTQHIFYAQSRFDPTLWQQSSTSASDQHALKFPISCCLPACSHIFTCVSKSRFCCISINQASIHARSSLLIASTCACACAEHGNPDSFNEGQQVRATEDCCPDQGTLCRSGYCHAAGGHTPQRPVEFFPCTRVCKRQGQFLVMS